MSNSKHKAVGRCLIALLQLSRKSEVLGKCGKKEGIQTFQSLG